MVTGAWLAATPLSARGAGVALDGPEVYKLDWGARDLTFGDLDSDGRIDIAVLNNDRGKVEILRQAGAGQSPEPSPSGSADWTPTLDDARFRRDGFTVGEEGYSLSAGDLDGDGRVDLAFTGAIGGLTVAYRGDDGDWSLRKILALDDAAEWTSTLETTDLDADGRCDLVVLTRSEALVFRQTAAGELDGPERYPLVEENAFGLEATDIDGDGRVDLRYLVRDKVAPFRVRFQEEDGAFGPEEAIRIGEHRGFVSRFPLPGEPGSVFGLVQAQTGLIELFRLRPGGPEESEELRFRPRVYAPGISRRGTAAAALGDFDGDGRIDVVLADGAGGRVWLYRQRDRGGFHPARSFPSVGEIRSVAASDLDGDGADELLVASSGESFLGVSRYLSANDRLAYPERVAVAGTPFTVAAPVVAGRPVMACVRRNAEARFELVILPSGSAGDEPSQTEPLELNGSPASMLARDLDGDGRDDLLVFTTKEAAVPLLQDASGVFRSVDLSAPGAAPLQGMDRRRVTFADLDGDGRPEWLVAGKGFARALRLDGSGFETVDQFNAQRSGVDLDFALYVDVDLDGAPEMVLKDRTGAEVQILRRASDGVYRHESTLFAGTIEATEAHVVDVDGDGRKDVVVFGKDRFWWVPVGRSDLVKETVLTHEPPDGDRVYLMLESGDFDRNGTPELIALDALQTHVLEILRVAGSAARPKLESALHFPVFEANPHYRGRTGGNVEPREIAVRDVTGDGIPDVILLVHDRVLVYPGK